ncbi:hypothetical protein BS47DRAFT_1370309 [Hydnum rufescens UP504]|uniref:MFS general substrate transporter n=1 Tax=Hydnum rufescens UP504 TaxID=1448309 RepID=A0A9P6BBK9_9AGAM|nr:hypothetical protein BS47DRAFT_1370309 [Hydnum rufescens UP504]
MKSNGFAEEDTLKHGKVVVDSSLVDDAAVFISSDDELLDPAAAAKVRAKIDKHLLPLMLALYWLDVQFIDKTTLGNSANLGIKHTAHLNANHNWLGTVFYLSYLVFEYPQNLALQRFPVGKWMACNIFIWAIALASHAACHSFGALFAVRFILGMCEGSITAGFLIVTSMFWTHKEQSVRVGYWFLMNGTAQIVAGLVTFGLVHIKHSPLAPWQWYLLITGILTLCIAVLFWFFFPDNPQTAWFLTPEERTIAIKRIRSNQSGVENKHFKLGQMLEALRDPKTWIFSLFNIPNSLTNQRAIIVKSFGFSTLVVTLLGCIDGLIEIVTIFSAVKIVERIPNSRASVAALYYIPNMLGAILILALPWQNRNGLLAATYLTDIASSGFVLSLGWVTAVTAGHTKRVTTQAIMLSSYCVGNIVGPQMWQQQYVPRNRVPWGVILGCFTICPLLYSLLRWRLARENRRRDLEEDSVETIQDTYIIREKADGTKVETHIDEAFLDLTDIENRKFRYVL